MSGRVRVTNRAGFRGLERQIDDLARAGLDELGAVAEGEVKRRMVETVDAAGHRGRVASGLTQKAVIARAPVKTAGGWEQTTEISPPQDHLGPIIEKGRKPGKGVSRAGQANLRKWARRKLGPVRAPTGRFRPGGRERAERSRVFLIARKIKRKGIPGIHVFRDTARWLRQGHARRIWDDVVRRLGGGR